MDGWLDVVKWDQMRCTSMRAKVSGQGFGGRLRGNGCSQLDQITGRVWVSGMVGIRDTVLCIYMTCDTFTARMIGM